MDNPSVIIRAYHADFEEARFLNSTTAEEQLALDAKNFIEDNGLKDKGVTFSVDTEDLTITFSGPVEIMAKFATVVSSVPEYAPVGGTFFQKPKPEYIGKHRNP